MIDLRPDFLAIVQEILQRLVPACEVRAFGSRQKWTAKETSDLDLVVVGSQRLPLKTMATLKEAFEESILPMRVDVLDWNAISEEFRRVIEAGFEVIQGGEASPLNSMKSVRANLGQRSQSPESIQILEEIGISCLPADWGIQRIEDLLSSDRGISVGVMYPGENTPGGIPLLKSGDLANNTINRHPEYFISNDKHAEYQRTQLSGGELLISLVGDIGRCAVVLPEMAGWNVARAVAVLRLENPGDAKYLRFLLLSKPIQHLMNAWATTTVQKTLNLKEIRQIPLPWPPQGIRNAIAHILGTLDERIELCRRMNETLEAMSRALFKDWFIDFGPVRAKMEGREPPGLSPEIASLFPSKLVDSELGEIPEGWCVKSIYDASSVIYGAPFASKQFNTEGNGKPLVRIRDLKNEAPGVYTDEVHPKGYLIQAGDIVVGMDGEFRAYLWGGESAWLNQRVCVFQPNPGIPSAFVRESIIPLLLAVEESETATTVIHLGKNDIDRFKIKMPSNDILNAFGDAANGIYDQIVGLKHKARTLSTLRDALLPKLLSGELSIPEAMLQVEAVG